MSQPHGESFSDMCEQAKETQNSVTNNFIFLLLGLDNRQAIVRKEGPSSVVLFISMASEFKHEVKRSWRFWLFFGLFGATA